MAKLEITITVEGQEEEDTRELLTDFVENDLAMDLVDIRIENTDTKENS